MRSARSALSSSDPGPRILSGQKVVDSDHMTTDGSAVRAGGRQVGIVGPISPEPLVGKGPAPSSEVPAGIWVPARTDRIEWTHAWLMQHLTNGL